MDATQVIGDSVLESDEEENEEDESKRGRPLAKLSILRNQHIPETDLPLFLGDNVLGRDPSTCTLPLTAPSISKQHVTISISVYRRRGPHSEVDVEALVWDVGSMNGTRKGRLKLTPNVRYALSDGDSLVVADIPCRYVSCAVDTVVSSQGDLRTSGSRNSDVKARLPDALGEKGGDKSEDSKKSVNSGAKVRVSSLKTPVRASCLSFEQTPTQPQGTLVPESDSDSDGERRGRGDGRRTALVSDSGSHKSSPTCSTFLSPTNKIVPESEDESPITPTSSTKNRPHKHVSFSREETEVDAHGQLLEEKKALAFVHDSEEEGGREEDRAAAGDKSEKSGQHVPAKEESNASVTGQDELPVSTPAVSTDAIPAFNMDSDTDIEGKDEGVASVGPVTLNTNQVSQPPNTAQFHMDSDTDVEEDEDTIDRAPKTVPTSVNSFIQPEEMTVDSDTDVDDDAAVSEAATEAKPLSFQTAHTADTVSLKQPKDFHLDSDTDVDEEEEEGCETNKPSSKIEGTPTRLTGPESDPVPVNSLHLDSDTDDETIPAPAPEISDSVVAPAATKSCTTADGGADGLYDSDTDVDDDSPLVIPVEVTALSGSPGAMSEVLESDSNDTDVDGCSMPPAGEGANPPDFRVDSDTDVEDKETDKGQVPSLCREKTPELQVTVQNCSTPAQLSGENVEVMETQPFLNPSSVPFKCAIAPVVRPATSSPCSDSQEDEDLVVAETQSFILQTRDCKSKSPEVNTMNPTRPFGLEPSDVENDEQSTREGSFQLGLSDSSHLPCPAQALALESTQAFASTDWRVTMEDTQAYATVSTAENDLNLEATQPYGKTEELARCSLMSEKEPQTDLALEATQAYTSEPQSDLESETDDDDARKHSTATAETQPLSIPTTCTRPVPQRRPHGELLCAETQPMNASDDNESDDEDSIPVPQRRKARPLQLEEEQTQPLIRSDISVVETQPMATSENEDSDDGDSIPIFRGKRAKPLQLECTQSLSCSEVSASNTQPMHLSCAQTQPMGVLECEQSDKEDLTPAPRKTKAKALQIEEEQTQPLISETQPIVTGEDNESTDEDLIPGPCKRRAKAKQLEEDETQPLTNAEVSAVETQPMEIQPEAGASGVGARNKRGTRARLRGEEEQAERSEPPKRQTRGKKKALTTTRGWRRKSKPDEDESEEEEKVEKARGIRGKKPMRQQKHDEEEGEQCEMEGDEHAENSSLIKENQEGRLEKEMERKEKEEEERLQTERIRLEQERVEKQRKEQEEKERSDQLQKEKEKQLERERKEREEKERLEQEKAEQEEKEKRERIEKERKEQEEKERLEREKRELEERLERERKEQELQERLQRETKEREERERLEKEKKELEERLERERKEQEHRAKLEREAKEREERERLEKEKKELEERLERERKEQEHRAKLEREAKEREERERLEKEQENKEEVNSKGPTRGRRAARRTVATPFPTVPEQDSTISTNDDVPARRTRSRSNSSNSVGSERSTSSVNTLEGRGRGRGRGRNRTSEPPQATTTRGSRRRTVAAETTEQNSDNSFPQGVLSRSNSTNSLNSDISSCSVSSQNRGRGSRRRESQRKMEPELDSIPRHDQKPAARGRSSKKTEGPQEDEEKADSQQASTTRGRRRASTHGSEPRAAKEDQPNEEEGVASKVLSQPKRNVRSRAQELVKTETTEASDAPAGSNGDESKDKRKGRKRELEENTVEEPSSSSKISKGSEKAQTTETTDEVRRDEENAVQAKRRGRASSARAKKNAKESPDEVEVKEESEKLERDIVEKKAKARPSAVQQKKKEEQESGANVSSMTENAAEEASEPRTPTTSASRKRRAPADSSPVAKTPRSSRASLAASGQQQAASQAYKVLFTGVVDEAGEKVLARLGGSMAKGVADMNCLVTDKVRRTVKFLCAVAKGIPIVTTQWLEKSGKAGSLLPPDAFLVKDLEQEKKFSFCLQESLRIASSQPLLQGYEIHVTKSVKPEPVHMKDIISCSGATFLPKMPSSPKPQTVVVSCEEDWSLCGPAVSASLPVVTAEFILTGILQQKVDVQTHTLSGPVANLQPARGRGRGRRKM